MNILVFSMVLVGASIMESAAEKKKIHIKIHVPKFIEHKHHTKLVFLDKPKPKPKPKEIIIQPVVKKQEIIHHHHIHHHNQPPKTAPKLTSLLAIPDDYHKRVFQKKQKYQTYKSEYGVQNGNPGYLSKYQKFPVDIIYKNRHEDYANERPHFDENLSDFDYHSRGYEVHEDEYDELEEDDVGENEHQEDLGF